MTSDGDFPYDPTRDAVIQAVAQAYCVYPNTEKTVDEDLSASIVENVMAVIEKLMREA